eukprot:gene1922-5723_t
MADQRPPDADADADADGDGDGDACTCLLTPCNCAAAGGGAESDGDSDSFPPAGPPAAAAAERGDGAACDGDELRAQAPALPRDPAVNRQGLAGDFAAPASVRFSESDDDSDLQRRPRGGAWRGNGHLLPRLPRLLPRFPLPAATTAMTTAMTSRRLWRRALSPVWWCLDRFDVV